MRHNFGGNMFLETEYVGWVWQLSSLQLAHVHVVGLIDALLAVGVAHPKTGSCNTKQC